MINVLNKPGIKAVYLNIKKAIEDKPIANIILNEKKKNNRNKTKGSTIITPVRYSKFWPEK